MYVCMHACMHACMHEYTHAHIHAYIHSYRHTHTYTCIYIHIHTRLPLSPLSLYLYIIDTSAAMRVPKYLDTGTHAPRPTPTRPELRGRLPSWRPAGPKPPPGPCAGSGSTTGWSLREPPNMARYDKYIPHTLDFHVCVNHAYFGAYLKYANEAH